MELMVVVLLISILTVIAVPAMRTARDDRLAFDYARQYSGIVHRASVRSMARGSAHLVAITASGSRGKMRLFEAVDGTPPPSGPRQVSSCKVPNQWAGVEGWAPPAANPPLSPVIDGLDLDTTGVNVDMNVGTTLTVGGVQTAMAVLCYTPGGNVYVGSGGTLTAAIEQMRIALPWNGVVQLAVSRRDASNTPLGLTRTVVIGGAAAPRIQSQGQTP